jgi:hypothetical protein
MCEKSGFGRVGVGVPSTVGLAAGAEAQTARAKTAIAVT